MGQIGLGSSKKFSYLAINPIMCKKILYLRVFDRRDPFATKPVLSCSLLLTLDKPQGLVKDIEAKSERNGLFSGDELSLGRLARGMCQTGMCQ